MISKIAIIAPSLKLYDQFSEFLIEENINDIDLHIGMLNQAHVLAKDLVEKGTELIISRTGNSKILKSAVDIPILSFELTIYDFLSSMINNNVEYKAQKNIGIFYFKEQPKEFEELDHLAHYLGFNVKHYIFHDHKSGQEAIDKAIEDDVTLGYGGVLTEVYAREKKLDYILVNTTRENFFNTINTARELLEIQDKERLKVYEYKTLLESYNIIMENTHSAVIVWDLDLTVTQANPIASQLLSKGLYNIKGYTFNQVFKGKINRQLFLKKFNDYVADINNTKLVINNDVIRVENEAIGYITTIQPVTKLIEQEQVVRSQLYKKGLYAKYTFDHIIGNSKSIQTAKKIARSYAKSEFTVLIHGQTGTGKELFAQSIHNYSNRSDKPFVAINCAALPENLLESELFGYTEGAFTGGKKGGNIGLFERAHNGTIFLDEIGEIPKIMQTKLLRVLQEKEIRKVGSDSIIPVNVRVICATNKNLLEEVEKGNFREDLYYRISVLNLTIPELKKRGNDISIISHSFLQNNHRDLYENNYNKWCEIINKIASLPLKGNIRELQNHLERYVIFVQDNILEDIHQLENSAINQSLESKKIENALIEHHWNKTTAAEELGISRTTLWRKMNEYNLTKS